MPSASELSATPESNTTIGGVNVGENCSPGGINNALRYLAAIVRTLYDQVQGFTSGMPFTGGTFTGDIFRQSRGAYRHNASSSHTSGREFYLPEGSALPAGQEGDVVWFYT